MGLLVSAVVRSEDQASSFIPLILVPQLLFGGAIVPTAQMGTIMNVLSKTIVAQWAFAGVGSTVHLHDRINEDRIFHSASRYGKHFFSMPPVATVLILGVFLGVFGFALLRRVPVFASSSHD